MYVSEEGRTRAAAAADIEGGLRFNALRTTSDVALDVGWDGSQSDGISRQSRLSRRAADTQTEQLPPPGAKRF